MGLETKTSYSIREWNPQSYSREVSGFLGINKTQTTKAFYTLLTRPRSQHGSDPRWYNIVNTKMGGVSYLKAPPRKKQTNVVWLVVSTHLKNLLVKMGSSSPKRGDNKNIVLEWHLRFGCQ